MAQGGWRDPWTWGWDILPTGEKYRANYDKIDWGKKESNPDCIACGHPKGSHTEGLPGCRGDFGECLCKGYVYCGEFDGCDERYCAYPGEEECRVEPGNR